MEECEIFIQVHFQADCQESEEGRTEKERKAQKKENLQKCQIKHIVPSGAKPWAFFLFCFGSKGLGYRGQVASWTAGGRGALPVAKALSQLACHSVEHEGGRTARWAAVTSQGRSETSQQLAVARQGRH